MRNYFIRFFRGSPHRGERDDGAQWVVPSVICTSHFCGKNYDTADARYLAYVSLQKYARKNRISRGRRRVLHCGVGRWLVFLPHNKFCNLFSYVTSWMAIFSGVRARRLPFSISVASRIKIFESNMPSLDFPRVFWRKSFPPLQNRLLCDRWRINRPRRNEASLDVILHHPLPSSVRSILHRGHPRWWALLMWLELQLAGIWHRDFVWCLVFSPIQ